MELILIRHGEAEGNNKNACLGKTDVALTQKGVRQMQTLSRKFYNDMVTAIYTSPLKRAVESCEAVNKYHNLPIEVVYDLQERDYGIWENKTFAEIEENYKEEYEMWRLDWKGYEIPMGESSEKAYDRNIRALKQILESNANGKVIVVTHEAVIKNIISYLLDMDLDATWHFKIKNAAVTRFEIDEDGYATMLSFNEI